MESQGVASVLQGPGPIVVVETSARAVRRGRDMAAAATPSATPGAGAGATPPGAGAGATPPGAGAGATPGAGAGATPPGRRREDVSRRDALAWLAAAGLATLVAACGASGRSASSTVAAAPTSSGTGSAGPTATTAAQAAASAAAAAAAAPTTAVASSCVLAPEQTEGPYFIAGEAIRSDITEGKAGTALRLALTVVNVNRCAAIANASIDIWHADAGGNYSGFGSASSNRTFLRGVQVTDATGAAGFHTIYPGWYQGRATHIHVKVHVGGTVVHTGQLFFDESTNQGVYATAPYSSHAGTRTLNSQDSIYASGAAQSLVRLAKEGAGYVGTVTLGIQA